MLLQFDERTVNPNIIVMELKGRMHLGNRLSDAEDAARRVIGRGIRKLVLDVTGVDHIDSAALGMLLVITGEMKALNGEVRVAGANDRIQHVVKLAHTDKVLSLDATVAEALSTLGATREAGA